jgi:hypothetical protein
MADTHSSFVKAIFCYRMVSRPDSASKTTRQELTQLAISDSLSEFRSVVRYKGDSLLIKYHDFPVNSPVLSEALNAVTNLPSYVFKGVIADSQTVKPLSVTCRISVYEPVLA